MPLRCVHASAFPARQAAQRPHTTDGRTATTRALAQPVHARCRPRRRVPENSWPSVTGIALVIASYPARPFVDVQVGAADAGGADRDDDLTRRGRVGRSDLAQFESEGRCDFLQCLHDALCRDQADVASDIVDAPRCRWRSASSNKPMPSNIATMNTPAFA